MPVMFNRFRAPPPKVEEPLDFLELAWSFGATIFPHLLSICIGIFLIYLNKLVNDRNSEEEVTTKSRSAPAEQRVPPTPTQMPFQPPVQQSPTYMHVPAPTYVPGPAPTYHQAPPPQQMQAPPALVPQPAPVQAPTPVKAPAPAPAPVQAPAPASTRPSAASPEPFHRPGEAPAPVPAQVSVQQPAPEAPKEAPMVEALLKGAAAPPGQMVSVSSDDTSQLDTKCLRKLHSAFPKAMANEDLVTKVASVLQEYGYGDTTLLATSLCCDEVNRALDEDFHKVYDHHFSMGGLAGFPFGGVTSFGAMAHHIPDGGSCLVVYGPHVGIDSKGVVGMIDRRGRKNNGACCGSAADACNHVADVRGNSSMRGAPPMRPLDAQQAFVRSMLLPYGRRLENADDAAVELPYALYDAMDDMMRQIVTFGSSEVAGEGKIALLGGIQINTPEEHSDYFLPLTFEIRDNANLLIDNLVFW